MIALPGPKGEFDPMAHGPVRGFLSTLSGGQVIHSRTLRIIGIGESEVEDRVRDLGAGDNPTLAPYAHTGEVHLRLTARAESREAAEALIAPVEAQVRERLGGAVYGRDDESLEAAILRDLTERGETVALAESMTGGGLAARLTGVPGSGKAFVGGAVVYSIPAKVALLGADRSLIEREGPVSEASARAIAEAARERLGATYGVGIVGNAGPDSDVDGKPVGLVHVAVAGPDGTRASESRFRGVRADIRRRGEQTALTMLRNAVRAREATRG